ncbi:MAG: RDD family protein [Chloroflexota bacterium]|nr:RDD family protein [Chloroflexota bacterium]
MDDPYLVSTPENVELRYTVAGLATRFFAALIDSIILAFLGFFILIVGLIFVAAGSGFGDTASLAILAVTLLLLFVLVFGYYIFFETVWRGQTPGKRALRLRVMRDDGLPLNFTASVIRNLIRFFDLLPGTYGFGVVAMFLNKRWKRLGDMAAGTVVIRDDVPQAPPSLQLATTPQSRIEAAGIREPLSDHEYELIREYLVRHGALSRMARGRVGTRLSAMAETRTGISRDGADPFVYLSRLVSLQAAR